eukprot:10300859-Heterocapsa_arctica.AAC.1
MAHAGQWILSTCVSTRFRAFGSYARGHHAGQRRGSEREQHPGLRREAGEGVVVGMYQGGHHLSRHAGA